MDYTGTFDGLAVDFATNKQKASLTLNEDARQAFENFRGTGIVDARTAQCSKILNS